MIDRAHEAAGIPAFAGMTRMLSRKPFSNLFRNKIPAAMRKNLKSKRGAAIDTLKQSRGAALQLSVYRISSIAFLWTGNT
jgi:hypothetical protein